MRRGVFIALFAVFFISGCATKAVDEKTKIGNEDFINKYAGLWIYDKKIIEEINENEKNRNKIIKYKESIIKNKKGEEAIKIVKENNPDTRFPRILSNGCKYDFNFRRKVKNSEVSFEEIDAYMGKELRYFAKIRLFYVCVDKTTKKEVVYPLIIRTASYADVSNFYPDVLGIATAPLMLAFFPLAMLFADDSPATLSRVIHLGETVYYSGDGENVFYLENGKFVKSYQSVSEFERRYHYLGY